MKFIKINNIAYDVVRKNKIVIPAGARNVEIAYRSASWTFINDKGEVQRGNVYKYKNKIYC